MNNINFLNLNPYPVDKYGKREQIKVLPTVKLPEQKLSYPEIDAIKHNLYSNEKNTQLNGSLDSRTKNETAFTLLSNNDENYRTPTLLGYNEEDYKTPITSDNTYNQCPKRKSSRPKIK